MDIDESHQNDCYTADDEETVESQPESLKTEAQPMPQMRTHLARRQCILLKGNRISDKKVKKSSSRQIEWLTR